MAGALQLSDDAGQPGAGSEGTGTIRFRMGPDRNGTPAYAPHEVEN